MDRFQPAFSYAATTPYEDWSSFSNDVLGGYGQKSWAAQNTGAWAYDQRANRSYAFDYDPSYSSQYGMYEPAAGFTQKSIDAGVQGWLQREYPELFSFESGQINTGFGTGGNVSKDPSFGQFAKTPEVYAEIEAAANKYGVPANFLLTILAKEGSGDWATNNAKGAMFISTRNDRILPYIGVFDATARSRTGRGIDEFVGNRAAQIDLLAAVLKSQYDEIRQRDPNYTWLNVASYHYMGDPNPSDSVADEFGNGTTNDYVNDVKTWWSQADAWVQANGGTVGGGGGTAGLGTINSPEWSSVNQWDALISKYAAQYGVPANLVKAIMRVESGGSPNANSPAGATGLMQVMPGMHGYSRQQLLDPETNIKAGVSILANNYRQWGSWQSATQAYLGGTPGSGASDGFNTQDTYWAKVQGYWRELDTGVQASGATAPGMAPGPMPQIAAVWGNATNPDGTPFEVTQEFGPTQWARDNPGMYEYSYALLGELGHPAIDVGMNLGTRLYTPVSGTVEVADGSNGFQYTWGDNRPQTGQLRIRLDNPPGQYLILGHMQNITVVPGQKLNAGDFVGFSGWQPAPHAHIEYRITRPDGSEAAVDPRQALAGLFTGQLSAGTTTGPGFDRPYTYQDLLRAGATGQTILPGATGAIFGGNSWNSWMQRAMSGAIPRAFGAGATNTGSFGQRPQATQYTGYEMVTNPYRWY